MAEKLKPLRKISGRVGGVGCRKLGWEGGLAGACSVDLCRTKTDV